MPPNRGFIAVAAHLLLALAGCAISALLIFTGGGHPPPIIFMPVVLALWLIGHLAIWGIVKLWHQGRSAAVGDSGPQPFPTALWPVLLITGVGLLIAVTQLLGTVLMERWYPYRQPILWFQMLATWLAHGACFVGLLRRRRWSRTLALILAGGWGWVIGEQLVRHLAQSMRSEPLALALAAALLLTALWLGFKLLRDPQIRNYLTR